MKIVRVLLLFLLIAELAWIFAPATKADSSNKLTYFTFSAPVELPGVALGPGTYAFVLLDSIADRNVVQVFDKDRKTLYGTFLTIQDYRPQPSEKTVIRFSETAEGGPPAIKEWFYPGDGSGQEFVYPKTRAVELAKASNQGVPSMPNDQGSNITQPATTSSDASVKSMEKAPLKAEQSNGDEVEIDKVFVREPPVGGVGKGNTVHNVNTENTQKQQQPQ